MITAPRTPGGFRRTSWAGVATASLLYLASASPAYAQGKDSGCQSQTNANCFAPAPLAAAGLPALFTFAAGFIAVRRRRRRGA